MSKILTDQGFVEVGGELTHWDRGYIKQGHKWITRKMKNGKWVYTYKKAKTDTNKYRDQAVSENEKAKMYGKQRNYYSDRAEMANVEASEHGYNMTLGRKKGSRYYDGDSGWYGTGSDKAKYANEVMTKGYLANRATRHQDKAYSNSEDAKRMQASAQRAANKKRNASPIHNAAKSVVNSRPVQTAKVIANSPASRMAKNEVKKKKKQITDWLNKRKTEKMKKRVKTGR